MLKQLNFFLLNSLLFFVFSVGQTNASEQDKLIVLTEEWAPYNYTVDGQLTGFSVEIVQRIIRDLDVDAEIELYPSMRASYMLNHEPRRLFISMFKTKERENQYQWIGPLVDSSIYFYKKKGSPLVIESLEDAKQVEMISTRHAGLVFDKLKKAGFTNLDNVSVYAKTVYEKLLHGRTDLGISESPLGTKHILRELDYPPDAVVRTQVKVVDSALYIAASKDIPDSEIALWQASLDKLKASGVYEEVLRKYHE